MSAPETCGMCWRGPGSNDACAEHREDYIRRLEADYERAAEVVASCFGLLGELERRPRHSMLMAGDVADWLDDALHPHHEVTA